jgi:AcrR family transcriptional regulator
MEVLQTQGIEGFNTNAVAQQADVNVGTLYHYFKDKNAILTELFICFESERVEYLRDRLTHFDQTTELHNWVHETLKMLLELRIATPGGRVLRNAVRVIPSLYDLGIEQDAKSAAALAAALRERYPKVPTARTSVVARIIIDAGVASLDRVGLRLGHPEDVINELTEMIVAYLETLEE